LNALGLFIQDIRETYNYGSLNEEYIQSTEEQCMNLVKHMSETIDDFRRFFAPNKKSMPFEMVWAVVETLKLVSAQLSSNSISFRVMCACGRKCFITENEIKDPDCKMRSSAIIGYEGEFKQVLLNLIHNTKDALEDRRRREGVPFDAFIDFAINVGKDEVTLEIKDNGGGIPPEVMPKIFDPYFTTKEEGKGTGIGLFMSRNIVEQHMKGHIYAESNGEFTTFVLKFRRAGDVNVP
jgi:signal transduction histidine kinase